jgi:hypothetical protein
MSVLSEIIGGDTGDGEVDDTLRRCHDQLSATTPVCLLLCPGEVHATRPPASSGGKISEWESARLHAALDAAR